MKTPKLILDIDGVIASFHSPLILEYNKRYLGNLNINDIDCELETLGPELYTKLVGIFNEPNWFLNLEPLPNAINTASSFIDLNYSVTICTAPARDLTGFTNPGSAAEKYVWIRKWLPFWANNVIITKSKELVFGDMLIDDTGHNIVNWCREHPNGIGFLLDQPWNKNFTQYPSNSVRGNLEDVSTIIRKFWCSERTRLVFRLDELLAWRK